MESTNVASVVQSSVCQSFLRHLHYVSLRRLTAPHLPSVKGKVAHVYEMKPYRVGRGTTAITHSLTSALDGAGSPYIGESCYVYI